MTSTKTMDMYNFTNSTYSNNINSITKDAVKVLKTIATQDIVFMKEIYQTDGCDDMGPYHHIWNFYVFTQDSNGSISRRHFNREYNEKAGEKSADYPYAEEPFTDYDNELIKREIEQQQYDDWAYQAMDYPEELPPYEPLPEQQLHDEWANSAMDYPELPQDEPLPEQGTYEEFLQLMVNYRRPN